MEKLIAASLSGANANAIALHDDLIGLQWHAARRAGWFSRPDIERALVKRALDQHAIDLAFAQRGFTVGAFVIGDVIRPAQIEDGEWRMICNQHPLRPRCPGPRPFGTRNGLRVLSSS
ncbi:hypothetical protein ACU4HD_00680 [Cupriavidus basilensis]